MTTLEFDNLSLTAKDELGLPKIIHHREDFDSMAELNEYFEEALMGNMISVLLGTVKVNSMLRRIALEG